LVSPSNVAPDPSVVRHPKEGVLEAVIFDLFNTLTTHDVRRDDVPWTADVLGVPRALWNHALTEQSGPRLTGALTDPLEIIRHLARSLDVSVTDDRLVTAARCHQQLFDRVLRSVPDANVDILRRLRGEGLRVAVLSNCDVLEIEAWNTSPLHRMFDVEVFSCQFGHAKPHPDIYRECLRRLNAAPENCIFVGDGGHGELGGARAVGIPTVLFSGVIQHTWPERIPGLLGDADYHISSLDQLFSLPPFSQASTWPAGG
jgi:putative hydrolase of the HAD superfamily